ncbi:MULTISPECIES: hypothetical protein [unclassified Streptomyces]|uniref:hypothetical protein n=1 Tax=unclassified Streptomyces TaxID=2593676 RepID=UPI00365F3056
MAFPSTPLDLLVEMQIGGTWVDITADKYVREALTIERGRPDEATGVDPARVNFHLNNRGNKYSPRNPNSPAYGLLGRNTPIRFSLPGTESYLATTGATTDIISTPDHASIDVTGDIDVRIEATVDWYSTLYQSLMGRWSSVNGNRSWILRLSPSDAGAFLVFGWSPTGLSANAVQAFSLLPQLPRRAALRATLDVNNGAGGWTCSLYWAESLDGPWNLLNTTTTTSGTTSVHGGTAPLEIAPTQTVIAGVPPATLRGRVHRAELRSGIAGSVVAAPDLRALAPGTTSWADTAGRTWTVAGAAAVSNREYRIHAEISDWPSRWDLSGEDIFVPVEASGILRRLGQGAKELPSTLRRRILSVGNPAAYWPMEEGREAGQAYSPLPGVAPLQVTGMEFAADDTLAGSSPLPKLSDAASMMGSVPAHTVTGSWMVACVFYWPSAPASETTLLEFATTGTASRVRIHANSTTVSLAGYTSAGATVFDFAAVTGGFNFFGSWNRLEITAADMGGGNVQYRIGWIDGADVGYGNDTTVAATAGIVTSIATAFGPLAADVRLGHLGVFSSSSTSVYENADNGWLTELAGRRLRRLADEEGLLLSSDLSTTAMGPQRPASLLTLLGECEASDGGLLCEDRATLGLRYRSREARYNQPVALTLDYAAGEVAPPFEPVDDDQLLRNDRTVARTGGSAARAVLTSGPLSVQAPPGGVGPYDDSQTLSLATDAQTEQIAAWLLHLGTWDEARYPTVRVNLAASPHLIPAAMALDVGDRVQIINPPPSLPPGPIDLLVEGYTETIDYPSSWDLLLNCSPAGPYSVAVADSTDRGRADTTGSFLAAAATSTATTLVVHTRQTPDSAYPRWVQDPAELPLDLVVAGEVVTASAITTLAEDTFTRTVAAGGWGTASDGHAYTLTGGTAAERSVAGGLGLITVTSSPTTLRMQTVAETCTDAEIRCTASVSAVATGASLVTSIAMRWASASSCYRARIEWGLSGAISLSAVVGSTLIDTSVSTGLTYAAGDQYEVRVRLIGHRILMRIWRTGHTEPGAWQLDRTATIGTLDSGQVGIGGGAFASNSNASIEYRFDNWIIESPQRATVTRSTNGVIKAQVAGADVRLAKPAITSY